MMSTMNEQHQQVEEKLSQLDRNIKMRMDEMMSDMSKQIDELRNAMNKNQEKAKSWSSVVAVEEKVDKIIEAVENQKKDSKELHGCVQNAVRMELQEDKEEMEEINKRKTSLIIHGLQETVNGESATTDSDSIMDLLHKINCDDVSVDYSFRLGKPTTGSQDKPRPVKVIVSSEAQKNQVLKSSKNLKGMSHSMDKVFIHQDLTPKQRAKRQLLVTEKKQREASGEKDLIIINDRIVKKLTRT